MNNLDQYGKPYHQLKGDDDAWLALAIGVPLLFLFPPSAVVLVIVLALLLAFAGLCVVYGVLCGLFALAGVLLKPIGQRYRYYVELGKEET